MEIRLQYKDNAKNCSHKHLKETKPQAEVYLKAPYNKCAQGPLLRNPDLDIKKIIIIKNKSVCYRLSLVSIILIYNNKEIV